MSKQVFDIFEPPSSFITRGIVPAGCIIEEFCFIVIRKSLHEISQNLR